MLIMLCDNMEIIPENKEAIKQALYNDIIVTRNIKDFKHSEILAVSPDQLLALYQK